MLIDVAPEIVDLITAGTAFLAITFVAGCLFAVAIGAFDD